MLLPEGSVEYLFANARENFAKKVKSSINLIIHCCLFCFGLQFTVTTINNMAITIPVITIFGLRNLVFMKILQINVSPKERRKSLPSSLKCFPPAALPHTAWSTSCGR